MLNQIITTVKGDSGSRRERNHFSAKITGYADYTSEELDQVFHILRNQRRRDVLMYLVNSSKQVTLSDLAEHIAARECGKPIDRLRSQERKRVYVGLHQSHLPKMDDFGIVNYDSDRGLVEPGPYFTRVLFFLRETQERPAERNPSSSKMVETHP